MGKIVGRYKVGKHFRLEIADNHFGYQRDLERIAAGTALDGLYVIRSSVGADKPGAEELVRSYKLLAGVERAFRTMKSVDLKVRPVHWFLQVPIFWLVGNSVREHSLRLESEKEALTHAAAADERARIARDMHDVVAHSVSVMVLQAEAARKQLRRNPDRAGDALQSFRRTDATPSPSFATCLDSCATLTRVRA